jgi:hypothetical protein
VPVAPTDRQNPDGSRRQTGLRPSPMSSERENLFRDIDGLKERILSAWSDMLSKPMTATERQELRDSLESLIGELNKLQTKLNQLPGPR